ncbi:methyltransferase domain-containing protein [Streptomyces sp. NPDC096205]|uniref:methyltransferase domain-containing protein n=1 Tax=Streptomyces sp. NPDC096205 TaxID=3366081 RepID=UPI003819B58F
MASSVGNLVEFTGVDGTDDASWFIRFMDVANAHPEYRDIDLALIRAMGGVSGKTVLDAACGTGDDAREIGRQVGGSGRVVGIDLSAAMVAEARRRSAGSPWPVEFATGDIRKLDFPDASFDAVRVKLVRQHCDDLDAADAELIRVTRPGGRIAVFDFDFEAMLVDHPDRATTREILHSWTDEFEHGWTGRQAAGRLRQRGLTDVTITPVTVQWPYDFFRMSLVGPLARAQASGALRLSEEQLRQWWEPLARAEEQGRFFCAQTGFVVGATR